MKWGEAVVGGETGDGLASFPLLFNEDGGTIEI